jgi:hypothetical protein
VVVVVAAADVAAIAAVNAGDVERTGHAVVAHRIVIVHADVEADAAHLEAAAEVEGDLGWGGSGADRERSDDEDEEGEREGRSAVGSGHGACPPAAYREHDPCQVA